MMKVDKATVMIPDISIIIPVYNDGEFVDKCLESIIKQSFNNIEIICVDDYSTDNSREIINFYAQQDSRIKLILNEKNSSAFVARKKGVAASNGKYIMFVDGDDELFIDACKIAFATITRQKVDIVQYETEIVNCLGVSEERIKSNKKQLQPCLSRLENSDLIVECFENKRFGFQLWNKIFNGNIVREALENIEDSFLPKAQDLYTFFLIAVKCNSYLGIDTELYKYNFGLGVTGGNNISLEKFRILCTEKDVADKLYQYIEKEKLQDKYSNIVKSIYKHFLNECISRWENNLIASEQSNGFNYLIEKFGYSEIINYYASKKWFNNIDLADKFNQLTFLKAKKRNTEKMTIAAYYRCIENGGAQRVVAMLCNLWAEMKDENGANLYNVVLIVDEQKGKEEYYLSPKVIREYLPNNAVKEEFIKRYNTWQKIIARNNIDIVISSMWVDPCTFWDMLAVKGHPSKPLFCIHIQSFSLLPYSFEGLQAKRQTKVYELSDGIVTLSDVDRTYISTFNEIVFTILNPIAFNPYQTLKSKTEDNKILWVGRISSEKNPLHAINMLKELVKIIPDAHLDIVGSGNAKIEENMKKFVKTNNLEENVTFHGFCLDVNKFYNESKVFICTSAYEGFSLTLCEAMSHALPIVTYDMPWLTLIRDGRGIVTVEQNDYKKMAFVVAGLLKNPKKSEMLGENGYKQICEIYNHNIGQDWYHFFTEANKNSAVTLSNKKYNERIIYKYLLQYNEQKLNKRQVKSTKELLQKVNTDNYLLRKLIGGFICYVEHGMWYTVRRIVEKIKNRF